MNPSADATVTIPANFVTAFAGSVTVLYAATAETIYKVVASDDPAKVGLELCAARSRLTALGGLLDQLDRGPAGGARAVTGDHGLIVQALHDVLPFEVEGLAGGCAVLGHRRHRRVERAPR